VANGGTAGGHNGGSGTGDMMYLKTILLQFLEQKDGRLRAQLVPVLGKLLGFDKYVHTPALFHRNSPFPLFLQFLD
jgi:hypothetical protein